MPTLSESFQNGAGARINRSVSPAILVSLIRWTETGVLEFMLHTYTETGGVQQPGHWYTEGHWYPDLLPVEAAINAIAPDCDNQAWENYP